MEVTAERRSKNLNFQFSYTFSHSLDENSNNPGNIVNSYDTQADYGNSDQNNSKKICGQRELHLPVPSFVALRQVVQGWQLNGILTYSDGIPFTALRAPQ